MKVVCIIVLFVIVAGNESAAGEADAPKAAKDTKKKNVTLHFPSYIPDHQKFALQLLEICNKNKTSPDSRSADKYYAINDKHVNFKNCTFLCKHSPQSSVTLDLPESTPCGPNGQTCENKDQCVPYIPGC
uniref:Putative ixodes 8-cys protein n=1 Tax=Ixodes ricinus TaxID=34613 RepID=A0A0K8RI41_IXORI